MQVDEQGVREPGKRRYQAIPRTLILLTRRNSPTAPREILLIQGAPTKRLWANRYNGLGGHIEANEDVLAAAQRELYEETGLAGVALTLRGVVNINTGADQQGPRPGVLMFVLVGEMGTEETHSLTSGPEGTPAWLPVARLDDYPLVDDLYAVIPLALGDGPIFYGHYAPRANGSMAYRFNG